MAGGIASQNLTGRTGPADARTAAWLLAVVAFLIVYGSLFPFRFASVEAAGLGELLGRLGWARTTRSDIAANVLLYVPLGACLAWLSSTRLRPALAVAVATAAGVLLSLAIEVMQLYETRRVASLADLSYNAVGTLAGALLAMAVAGAHRRLAASALAGVLKNPVAAALVLSWIGYRLAPFAFVPDPSKWLSAFAPLGEGWPPAGGVLGHAIAWLVVFRMLEMLTRAWLGAAVAAMAAVLAGRVLIAGLALSGAEIAGMAVAAALAWPLARLAPARSALLLAWALAVAIGLRGLAPFDFQLARDSFGLVPFAESLITYRAANLPDMFLKCFSYGALVWLLARGGLTLLAATLAGAGLVFCIELLQTWLPAHTADITDPLLAVAAGGLIAVFERGGRTLPGTAALPDGLSRLR